jgi:hypothetical protein
MVNPKYIILDFEQALSDRFIGVFPNAIIARDYFHFVQTNVKYLGELGMKGVATEVSDNFRVLWYKLTKEEFDIFIIKFLAK